MSVRSFQRAHARRLAREQRRTSILRRRGSLIAGLAVSGTMMLAGSAQAATYTVTTTGDDSPGGTCTAYQCTTLRDALSSANVDSSADTITFAPGVTGAITLGHGELPIANVNGLTITGPGSGNLTIDANHASRVFDDTIIGNNVDVAITGLTMTNGSSSSPGGAVFNASSNLSLSGDVISNSTSSVAGGGIYTQGALTVTASTISGNSQTGHSGPEDGGGIAAPKYFGTSPTVRQHLLQIPTKISDSQITGNTADGYGGGIAAGTLLEITNSQITNNTSGASAPVGGGGVSAGGGVSLISGSTITGNQSASGGGGVALTPKYGSKISNSTISGNSVAGSGLLHGGGLEILDFAGGLKYSPVDVENSTISGNQAHAGAGMAVDYGLNRVNIDGTTISGNTAQGSYSYGGGLLADGIHGGVIAVSESTISGNTATVGGGVSIGAFNNGHPAVSPKYGTGGTVSFDNSTIAANTGTAHAGGIYLSQYQLSGAANPNTYYAPTASLTSTIVSGNTAAGISDDMERGGSATTGGINATFSLIQSPGTTPILSNNRSILGVSARLGPLQGNGGPTQTMLPSGTSPVIDQGHSPSPDATDQRGLARTVDTGIANPVGGDGTDIGAVELPASAVVIPPAPPTPTAGTTLSIHGSGLNFNSRPLLVGNQTPVTCSVKTGVLHACVIEVMVGNRKIGSGEVTSAGGASSLTTQIAPTRAGLAYLKNRQLGVDAVADLTVSQSAAGALTQMGNVHFLAGPAITIGLGTRSTTLSQGVITELGRVAKLLKGVKSYTCTAYTDSGRNDKSLTSTQATNACARLKSDGLTGKSHAIGRGSANRIASDKTAKGRATNRRLTITFTF